MATFFRRSQNNELNQSLTVSNLDELTATLRAKAQDSRMSLVLFQRPNEQHVFAVQQGKGFTIPVKGAYALSQEQLNKIVQKAGLESIQRMSPLVSQCARQRTDLPPSRPSLTIDQAIQVLSNHLAAQQSVEFKPQ